MEYPILTTHKGELSASSIVELCKDLDMSVLETIMSGHRKAHQEDLGDFIYEISDPFHPGSIEDDIPSPECRKEVAQALEKGMLIGLLLADSSFDDSYKQQLGMAELKIQSILSNRLASEPEDYQLQLGRSGIIAQTGLDFYRRFERIDLNLAPFLDSLVNKPYLYDYVKSGIGLMLLLYVISKKMEDGEEIEEIGFTDGESFETIHELLLVIESLPNVGEGE